MRRANAAGFRVLVPATWKYRDDSTVASDYSRYIWYDPTDQNRKLRIDWSTCAGCAFDNLDEAGNPDARPDPGRLVPRGTVTRVTLGPDSVAFTALTSSDPYPDNGIIAITHDSADRVAGYVTREVWLPEREHGLATTILNGGA